MIEVNTYIKLPEVVPADALAEWKRSLKDPDTSKCPPEVISFVEAISAKMSDFGRIKTESVKIIGFDLKLSGLTEIHGLPINPWEVYDFDIPVQTAVDHRRWMYRCFNRRGKQGLISYCKNQVKGTELERVLSILNVHVFKLERVEFSNMMDQIKAAAPLA